MRRAVRFCSLQKHMNTQSIVRVNVVTRLIGRVSTTNQSYPLLIVTAILSQYFIRDLVFMSQIGISQLHVVHLRERFTVCSVQTPATVQQWSLCISWSSQLLWYDCCSRNCLIFLNIYCTCRAYLKTWNIIMMTFQISSNIHGGLPFDAVINNNIQQSLPIYDMVDDGAPLTLQNNRNPWTNFWSQIFQPTTTTTTDSSNSGDSQPDDVICDIECS